MQILVVICSKSPNPHLYECIEHLYRIQMDPEVNSDQYKVVVVDSDSDDFTEYDKVSRDFPEVEIHFAKNRNYEYGAWKYAYTLYPTSDIYFCIQDTNLLHYPIDLSLVQENCVYTFHVDSGFDLELRDVCRELLAPSGLEYEPYFDRNFCIATHSIFIVRNQTIADLLQTLPLAPTNKFGSCSTERIFGLYFILKGIRTMDMSPFIQKIFGSRR
jgi:hypothetical protein